MITISLACSQGGGVKAHARGQSWLLSQGEVTLKGVYVSYGAQMPPLDPGSQLRGNYLPIKAENLNAWQILDVNFKRCDLSKAYLK